MVEHQFPGPMKQVRLLSPAASCRLRWLARFSLLLVAAILAAPAWSQSSAETLAGSRPGRGGSADVVSVRFGLVDIVDVDDRHQQFSIDAFVELQWRDPRLASETLGEDELRTLDVAAIWTPGLLILNSRGLDYLLPDVANVDRDGNVILRRRLAGQLATDLALRDFPFDTQDLTIDIISYRHSPAELQYADDSEIIADTGSFRSKGWHYEVLEPKHLVYRLTETGPGTPMLRFTVRAERKSAFYVLTLALPMTLILFLAWLVHWLPPTVVPSRIAMASATVFSLIALGVSVRLTLPVIDYLTRADRFVVFATLLVAASLAVTVVASGWASCERVDDAAQLSRRMRIALPFAYALIVLVTLVA